MSTRIGLLVPSSNTVMEVDFYRALPPRVTVHTGRMYLEATTVQSEEVMLDEYTIPAARVVATTDPDFVVFGCTSAGALRGTDYDTELCRRITKVTGVPTISVIKSVRDALKASGGSRVAILTPYLDELNQPIKASIEADGFEVMAIHGMGIRHNLDIGRVGPREIVEFARRTLGASLDADTLFVSCTNLQAVSALSLLEEVYGVPVVTSNRAALDAVCRKLSAPSV